MNPNQTSNATQANALLTLITETSLHAGAGSSLDSIDLPIMREGHTGYPCVFGSAVKGAIRTKAEYEANPNDDMIKIVFGPKPKKEAEANSSEHAGALNVGDARLLLLPVRSLTTQFKWVTCPYLLNRLKRDAERLGLAGSVDFDTPSLPQSTAGNETALSLTPHAELYLEEFRFKVNADPKLEKVIQALNTLLKNEFSDALQQQLIVVSDDMFSHFSSYATPVAAHIAIESDTKTVKDGALWYEETLPPETVLYVALNANRARWVDASKNELPLKPKVVLEYITKALFNEKQPAYLQLGGNETVGMGWCRVFSTEA